MDSLMKDNIPQADVQGADLFYLLLRKIEVRAMKVLSQPCRVIGLRDHRKTSLSSPSQEHLRRSYRGGLFQLR